jgi:plastocyanin
MLPQNQLDPASLTIRTGTTVVWYNMGQLPQTVTCDPAKAQDKSRVALPKGAQPWDSGVLYPGQSWTYTFQTPGNYLFFSQMQDTPGMVGMIKVTQ